MSHIFFRSFDFKFSVREWVSAASDASNSRYASDVSDARIMTPDQPLTPSPASQLPAWLSSWTGREGGKSQRCTHVRNINHLLKLVECEVSRISLLKNDKRLQRRLLNRRINAGLKNIFWLLDKFLVYLEFFSAPGSKPSSSFAVSYPLQFPLILGRSNLFLNLWQVQFVNNFSKAAKVIGTKTSQADQQL